MFSAISLPLLRGKESWDDGNAIVTASELLLESGVAWLSTIYLAILLLLLSDITRVPLLVCSTVLVSALLAPLPVPADGLTTLLFFSLARLNYVTQIQKQTYREDVVNGEFCEQFHLHIILGGQSCNQLESNTMLTTNIGCSHTHAGTNRKTIHAAMATAAHRTMHSMDITAPRILGRLEEVEREADLSVGELEFVSTVSV